MRQYSSRLVRIRAERRLRRGGRGALAALALAALTASAGIAVLPAEAVPVATVVAPRVRVIAGDSALTASWSAMPNASQYTVRIREHRPRAKARVLHTTKLVALVKHLRNGHTYDVAVTAVPRPVAAAATAGAAVPLVRMVRSAVVHVTAHRGVPLPVGAVHVSPGALPNQLRVDWTGGDKALKVGLVAGSDINTSQRMFHSAWYPATVHSITITVPVRYRTTLGAGTGTPIFVKVAQSNSASTVFHHTFDYTDKYRTSTVGSWGLAAAAAAPGDVSKLRVGELNTQTNGATQDYTRNNQWAARAPRVAKLIESGNLDLLGSAELSTNQDPNATQCVNPTRTSYTCGSRTQYQQLARLLPSLTLADPDAYDRVTDQMRANQDLYSGHVTDGAHLFYNPASLTELDHGFFSPALPASAGFANVTGLGVPGWMSVPDIGGDRWMTWAKFRTNDAAQRVFYAVSAHLPVGDAHAIADARDEAARRAESAITAMAGSTPIVFVGDFNSDPTRSYSPAQAVFMQRGWFDAAAVADTSLRTNVRYTTTNDTGPQTGADQGYPLAPFAQKWPTSRIDFILLKNSPHTYSYDNVLRLRGDGTFDPSYLGTDHHMQVAVIGIGDPAPAS